MSENPQDRSKRVQPSTTSFRKCLLLFSSREKASAAWLIGLLVLGAALETLGIGLVFPFIALLDNPDRIREFPLLVFVYTGLGLQSTKQFLLLSAAALALLFIFKNGYLALLNYLQYRFIFDCQANLAQRLFSGYLRMPYALHLQRNTADAVKNITTEITGLFNGVITPAFVVTAEALVLAMILALLLSVEPWVTVAAVAGVGAVGAGAYSVLASALEEAGRRRSENSGLRVKLMNQSIAGLKEIRILGRESHFATAFDHSNREYSRAARIFATVNAMPRLIMESLAVCAVVAIVVFVLLRGNQVGTTTATLAMFAMAALRLMPSVTRTFSAVTSMRFYLSTVGSVHRDLEISLEAGSSTSEGSDANAGRSRQMFSFAREIVLDDVWYRYPGSDRWAVKRLRATIPRGTSVALVGPSGAGKSTTIDLILGLLVPQRGRITVDGVDIFSVLRGWQSCFGYVPQTIALLDDSIRRNVALGIPDGEIDETKVTNAIRRAQLESLVASLPEGPDTIVGERGARLSGGECQRVGIARALYHEPGILVFDEATSALDGLTESEISETIRSLTGSRTVIVIAHRMSTVERANVVFFLNRGELVDTGSFGELIRRNQEFREMVGQLSNEAPPARP